MSHTHTSIHIHFVFSTKYRDRCLTPEVRERLWQYLSRVAIEHKMQPLAVNGVEDHCHVLVGLPSSMSAADAAKQLKGASSRWLSTTFPELLTFRWQVGYGAFTVSKSRIDTTISYIANQEVHHQTQSFEEEYVSILQYHHIPFDPKTLWADDERDESLTHARIDPR